MTGASEPFSMLVFCWSSDVRNFRKSSAVALYLEYELIAAMWPPSVEVPGPLTPGSGATLNLPLTLDAESVLARLYTYGQLRRNSSLPFWNEARLCSSW